jgi:hypothetical protein
MNDVLDILAVEPFYAGGRRMMLETLVRRSRHKWTVLRLPGRRIERRLEAAAQWFAEVVLRRPPMAFDLLVTSEAINLPELYQLCPELSGHPSVVYFHDNQLPLPGRGVQRPIDHVNLLTALEASEVWFNSLHHMRTFMGRAGAVVRQLPHYFDPDALRRLTARTSLVRMPVEVDAVREIEQGAEFERKRRSIFVDLRGGDTKLLAEALATLRMRGEDFELITVGPRGELPADLPRQALPEYDEDAQTFVMARCGTYISVATDSTFDPRAVMALASGMHTLLPDTGSYPELVPSDFQASTLYQPHPQFLASALQDVWALPSLRGWNDELRQALGAYDAETAVGTIDWKLSSLAASFHAHQSDRSEHEGGDGLR